MLLLQYFLKLERLGRVDSIPLPRPRKRKKSSVVAETATKAQASVSYSASVSQDVLAANENPHDSKVTETIVSKPAGQYRTDHDLNMIFFTRLPSSDLLNDTQNSTSKHHSSSSSWHFQDFVLCSRIL